MLLTRHQMVTYYLSDTKWCRIENSRLVGAASEEPHNLRRL